MPLVRSRDEVTYPGDVSVYCGLECGVELQSVDQLGQPLLGDIEVVHLVVDECARGKKFLFSVDALFLLQYQLRLDTIPQAISVSTVWRSLIHAKRSAPARLG